MKTLNELFDSSVKWKKVTKFRYDFVVDDIQYYVVLMPLDIDPRTVNVVFYAKTGDIITTNMTGTGNEIKVLSTVVAIMKDFVNKNKNIYSLVFSAKESSRKQLYGKMIKRLAKNFKVNKGKDSGDTVWTLSRK